MRDSELASLVVRIAAVIAMSCVCALLSWWGMYGPAWTLVGATAAVCVSMFADLGRHSHE